MVKNPPAKYSRQGFDPWSGKIPRAEGQLSPDATTTEPTCLESVLHGKRSPHNEKPVQGSSRVTPLRATRGEPAWQ